MFSLAWWSVNGSNNPVDRIILLFAYLQLRLIQSITPLYTTQHRGGRLLAPDQALLYGLLRGGGRAPLQLPGAAAAAGDGRPLWHAGRGGGLRGGARAPFRCYDDALAYFQHVPELLPLQKAPLHVATKAAGDALAVALGPVEKLWRAADACSGYWIKDFVLDERVAALPIGKIEALLRSEELQLRSENCCFTLAHWWVMKQEGDADEVLQPLFNRLLKSLIYARMSPEFLAAMTDFGLVKDSGLLPSIMRRALWRRDYVFDDSMPPSRIKDSDRYGYTFVFSTHLTRAAVEVLAEDQYFNIPLGVFHGHPCHLTFQCGANGTYSLCLVSEYIQCDEDEEDASWPLAFPEEGADWRYADDDTTLALAFSVYRGRLGTFRFLSEEERLCVTRVHDSSYLSEPIPASALVHDEEGTVRLELELEVEQHKDC